MNADSFFQPPAHAVADDGISDLLSDRETNARWRRIAPVEHFHEKKPPAALFTSPDGQKFRPLAEPPGGGPQGFADFRQVRAFAQAESRLRPPTVLIRARNPCRRLRTSLLGW